MLSLYSKSYIIEDANGKQKISCKGISKRNPLDPMKKFEECLKTKIQMDQKSFHSSEQLFYYLIAAAYNQDNFCEKIMNNTDPLELQPHVNSFQEFNPCHNLMESMMRLVISLKFQQVTEFKQELISHCGKHLAYKQINFDKAQETFWGVTVPRKLVTVLDIKNTSGNNLMGVILMDCMTSIQDPDDSNTSITGNIIYFCISICKVHGSVQHNIYT